MKNILITIILLTLVVFLISKITNLGPQTAGVEDINMTDNTVIKTIDSNEFFGLTDNTSNILLDIRTSEEFAQGHIKDAENIDYYSRNFKDELGKLKKDNTYLIYCKTGNRSSTAIKIFKALGFTSVYELEGGLEAWSSTGHSLCVNC
jgi:rhodanese-related sulfurtransferase